MSRPLCSTCQRPQLACICQFISSIDNNVLVVVLLHPKEVNQSKGTLPLLAHSLTNCLVIEGEDFSDNEQLNQLISRYRHQIALLYPSDSAIVLTKLTEDTLPEKYNVSDGSNYKCLILLDATWKKAYRMYMLSKNLQLIDHLVLPDDLIGQYTIRKTDKKNALSTLEACCYALEILEKSPNKYQKLLDGFIGFNQFQLSFRKSNH